MKLIKEILCVGASVVVLAFASIGVWHWYWESSPLWKEAPKEENVEEPKEPQLVVCFPWADDNIKKGYPVHWGPEPNIQTRDYKKLPEPYGYGSGTLKTWIEKNQANDAKNK